MKSLVTLELSRRDVLRAGAGLTLAIGAGSLITACGNATTAATAATADATPLAPGHFLSISADDIVTVISPNTEMGQGAYTGLATLVTRIEMLAASSGAPGTRSCPRRRVSAPIIRQSSALDRAACASMSSAASIING